MKKLFSFALVALLALGLSTSVRAESSGQAYDGTMNPMQVFVDMYNNTGTAISSNSVVAVQMPGAQSQATGAYCTFVAATADIASIGVTDEYIATNAFGRICIRGPHLVKTISPTSVTGGPTTQGFPVPGQWVIAAYTAGWDINEKGSVAAATLPAVAIYGYATRSMIGWRMGDSTYSGADPNTALIWIWVQPAPMTFDNLL